MSFTEPSLDLQTLYVDDLTPWNEMFHGYPDETQAHFSIRPGETDQLVKRQACLKDKQSWKTL